MSELRHRWHWLMGDRDLYHGYQQCLAYCRPGDALLLLGQHVYLLADQRFLSVPSTVKLYVLEEALLETGLNDFLTPDSTVINWNQVLNLLIDGYPLQQTWR